MEVALQLGLCLIQPQAIYSGTTLTKVDPNHEQQQDCKQWRIHAIHELFRHLLNRIWRQEKAIELRKVRTVV